MHTKNKNILVQELKEVNFPDGGGASAPDHILHQ
jgi:hypothetical protein